MDIGDLRRIAKTLKRRLEDIRVTEPDASICLSALGPIFDRVFTQDMVPLYEDVPCDYYFYEGALSKYKDVGELYSVFSLTILGIK
ncbi:MAG TPA: hypothetical protein VHW66_20365 [Stellaceae bacterium]|jgi:hypothetical protein|nr:hypothetical protein [Stellaceae bacterium]